MQAGAQDPLEALASYIEVLERSASTTTHANDRPAYERHRATASALFLALHRHDFVTLAELVASEERSYSQWFLADAPGRNAENAFRAFARQTAPASSQPRRPDGAG